MDAVMGGDTPLSPILFAIWPILSLYGDNMSQMNRREIVIPIAVAASVSIVTWVMCLRLFRDRVKATLASSLFWLLFFSYGATVSMAKRASIGLLSSFGDSIVFAAFALILSLSVISLNQRRTSLKQVANSVGVFGIVLVILPTVSIVSYEVHRTHDFQLKNHPAEIELQQSSGLPDAAYPNIYYIIMDGYGREDVLQDYYQFDNSKMMGFLTEQGFHVLPNARANYCQTMLSLSSSLNITYLDGVSGRTGIRPVDRRPLHQLVQQSHVSKVLKQRGYKTIAFESGYSGTEMAQADIYLRRGFLLSEFQYQVFQFTPMLQISKSVSGLLRKADLLDYYEVTRKRISFTLDHLRDPMQMEGPVFVFAHIIAPHPPFVFGRRGERTQPGRPFTLHDGSHFVSNGGNQAEYVQQYRDQLVYINSRLRDVLCDLTSDSSRPTVIIIQSDHGPGSRLHWENLERTDCRERLAILQALHFPDFDYGSLPDDMTPVNTFRVVFNRYFDTQYPMLPNRSYYSRWSRPYEFVDVTADIAADESDAD